MRRNFSVTVLGLLLSMLGTWPIMEIGAAEPSLPGHYQLLDEPSRHEPGKVILFEFADFYCPHCHMFETRVVPLLKQEFGEQLEVRLVGFPVIPNKPSTAFEMYEQAKLMGKGQEMKRILFRTIHEHHIPFFDKSIRAILIKAVGLDVHAFEEGLKNGQAFQAFQEGIRWGERIGVSHTPTIVLDGNILVDQPDVNNLKTIIRGILARQ
ncbi:MAG: disulfide bond formation protein DsbA [Nitrospirae bacterium]|nr:MAG: disulfide bond formation protein DsbA [Nitrospirota bacterium]